VTGQPAPTALNVARQRIECRDYCHGGRGYFCFDYNGAWGLYSYCDDGEGTCPAPDCSYKGACLCLCHTPMGTP
jgi:hypothetical protein